MEKETEMVLHSVGGFANMDNETWDSILETSKVEGLEAINFLKY